MNDFFDTGIIIGTAYIQDINYEGFDPKEIDSNSELCYKRFNKYKVKIICNTVQYELKTIIETRRIMHKIVLLKLTNANNDLIIDEMLKLPRLHERDLAWLTEVPQRLKKHDLEDVYHTMENIRTIFELNINKIVSSIDIFRPDEKQKLKRSSIKKIINSLPEIPNENDIIILSNAIIYHNEKKEINFVSADKLFDKMDHTRLEKQLKSKALISDYPIIEIITAKKSKETKS